ncbi:MAG: hypothetical protein AAGF12_42980, partial [Myxococcota bacterium]
MEEYLLLPQPVCISGQRFIVRSLDGWSAEGAIPTDTALRIVARASAGDETARRITELKRRLGLGELVLCDAPKRSFYQPIAREEEPEPPVAAAPELDFIEIRVIDEDEQPVPDIAYEIQLPDGSTVQGMLNAEGSAR